MCDLNGPFKLCTCESEIDKTKPHWILHRFLKTKNEIFAEGEFSNPNLYELYLGKKLKRRLNTVNVFDFEYSPQHGDYLELFVKQYQNEDSELTAPDFRLEYVDSNWILLEDFEMSEYIHQSKNQGEVIGPMTDLTIVYKDFLENSSEYELDRFLELTTFRQPPISSIKSKELLSIFRREKFSMYKCYGGELENPFQLNNHQDKGMFWWIEMVFENEFYLKYDVNAWKSFFSLEVYSKSFSSLIVKGKLPRNTKTKTQLFHLWLEQSWEHYGVQHKEKYEKLARIESYPDFENYLPTELPKSKSFTSDLSVFSYFKGEQSNPFNKVTHKYPYMFWRYESIFESKYLAGYFSSKNFKPSGNQQRDNEWLTLLNSTKLDKEEIHKLWCFELLFEYLPLKGDLTGSQYSDMYFGKNSSN